MVTKSDVKRLLGKGLTGWEAGLLVFEDSWLSERNQEAFLTDRDIERLKSSLRSQQDIQDYNLMIRLFRTADYIEKQALQGIQIATALLERIAGVGFIHFAPYMAKVLLSHFPLPVTEKQLQDLKADQKEEKLKRLYCMDQVIAERAYYLAPEETKKDVGWEPECIEEGDAALYQKAKAEIEAMIQDSQLPQPVELDIQAWDESIEEERKDISYWTGNTDWTPEEAKRLIQHYIPGEALYKAGLPEWIQKIEAFELWRLPNDLWLGYDPPPYVAIIQEPEQWNLDKRGHFKLDFMKAWPLQLWPSSESERDWSGWAKAAIEPLKKTLARRQALEDLSHVTGLALHEWADFSIDTFLKPALGRYNLFVRTRPPEMLKPGWTEGLSAEEISKAYDQVEDTPGNRMSWLEEGLRLPPIKLAKLKPPAKGVAEIRGWISEILGDEWWTGRYKAREPRSLLPEEARAKWQKMIKQDQEEETRREEARRQIQKRRAELLKLTAQEEADHES